MGPNVSWQVRSLANWVNLSTPLGLAVATLGRATVSSRDRGVLLATDYRYAFPPASAFTVGSVVVSRHDRAYLAARPELLAHEERHTTQYAVCLGLPFLPLYLMAAGWSWLQTGDPAAANVFERRAGLADGHYAVPTPEQVSAVRADRRRRLRRLVRL